MTPPDGSDTQVVDVLARELLAIHEQSYGVGASTVRAHLLDDTIVVFLEGLQLQRSEEFLIERNQAELVLRNRAAFQDAIEGTFRAAVERATGRKVESFVSATKLDPPYCVEIFRLYESPTSA